MANAFAAYALLKLRSLQHALHLPALHRFKIVRCRRHRIRPARTAAVPAPAPSLPR
jgi:hypothetical protein